MESAVDGSTIIAKLDDGEDLFRSLRSIARTHSIVNGVVLFGIGQLRYFELGYFDGTTYQRKVINEPYELVGLHGTLTPNLDPPMHLHAALSKDDFTIIGGHLFKATVATLNELCIQRLSAIQMGRELDMKTGLRKLTVRQGASR